MSQVRDRAMTAAIVLVAVVLLAPRPIALANSLPRGELWLAFDYQTSEHVDLEGVQIIGCDTVDCVQPVLIDQYGTCGSPGCLADSPPAVFAIQNLRCLDDRCVLVFHYIALHHSDLSFFRVVGQFSDRIRESDVFPSGVESWHWESHEWRVTVQDTALSVSPDDSGLVDTYPLAKGIEGSGLLQSFALTAAVEALVALLVLCWWRKFGGRNLARGLRYVLLANLISYPVIWILWPSLRQFQSAYGRATGCLLLLYAGLLTGVIAYLTRRGGAPARRRVILLVVVLSVVTIGMLVCWLYVGLAYDDLILIPGLPAGLTVALAEVSAVAYEALLLYLLARRHLALTWKQAGVVSLAMNATSFVLSLVIYAVL